MKKYPLVVKSNPYYRCPEGAGLSVLTNIFDTVSYDGKLIPRELTAGLEEIMYFSLLLGYGAVPTPSTDLFEFFEDTDLFQLQNNKNTILIFDCTFEGLSQQDNAIAQSLEYSCIKRNINPKKIFLFTGNLKPVDYSTNIHIIPLFILDLSFRNSVFDELSFESAYNLCRQNLSKIVLSLSRRNRPHRVWAHFMLSNSSIVDDCIISQAPIEVSVDGISFGKVDLNILSKTGLTQDDFTKFHNKLPMVADGNNFHINDPFGHLVDLHSKTVFSIVNETLADNANNTSLFYSEKFLKPIINGQPMLIYGQRGINKQLGILGFKTYESYFNLDFDDEPDDIIRYKKLLISATTEVNHLRSLTKDQQIEWRFKNSELLEFNFRNLMRTQHLIDQMTFFLRLVRQFTDNL
jgi:hypothetical protein